MSTRDEQNARYVDFRCCDCGKEHDTNHNRREPSNGRIETPAVRGATPG